MTAGQRFTDRRTAVVEAVASLDGIAETLWEAPGETLADLLGELDRLVVLATAARVAVTEEAQQRGEVAASQEAGLQGWIRKHAPSLAVQGAGTLATCVTELGRPVNAEIRRACLVGRVSPAVALSTVREWQLLRPDVVPGAEEAVCEALISMGASHGSSGVRDMRDRLLATYGHETALADREETARHAISLSRTRADGLGCVTYRWTVDKEGAAAVEAALGPLSAPRIDPETSLRDQRTPDQRRGQALLDVVRHATALADTGVPTARATLMVTIDHEALSGAVQQARQAASTGGVPVAGSIVGTTEAGTLLSAAAVRRLACDADLLPVVLGGQSEILDLGRQHRAAQPHQVKALWLRDRTCTFPGCTIPATWTEAHHLTHWLDGGATSMDNLGLLCGRHHTIVHRDGLQGALTDGVVTWDTAPGSYTGGLSHTSGAPPPGPRAA